MKSDCRNFGGSLNDTSGGYVFCNGRKKKSSFCPCNHYREKDYGVEVEYAPHYVTIVSVAYLHNGKIYALPAPARHHHIIRRWGGFPSSESGFLTSEGKFVGRKEGYIIARDAGQLIRDTNDPKAYQGDDLFSEDVW